MAKMALLLAEGFEEVEAVTPADFLTRAGINVYITGVSGKTIRGSRGITLAAEYTLETLPDDLDGVVIPGGMPGSENVALSRKAMDLIRKMDSRGKIIGAICAAPAVVLEKAGVLKGRKATCFPGMEKRFVDAEFSEDRVVVDGNIITSRAPGTAAEFSITLIRVIAGEEAAKKVYRDTLQKF